METKLAQLRKKKKSKKGFTLVELVIVIAVLAIIAGIATFTVQSVVKNANAAADKSNAQAIEMALKTFESENASYSENQSANVLALLGSTNAGDENASPLATKNKVTDILTQYGVDPAKVGLNSSTATLKQGSSYHYYHSDTLGSITVSSSSVNGATEITSGTTYTFSSGKLSLTT